MFLPDQPIQEGMMQGPGKPPSVKPVDTTIREKLKVSDPSDPAKVAEGLRRKYPGIRAEKSEGAEGTRPNPSPSPGSRGEKIDTQA